MGRAISRRDFLDGVAIGVGALALGGALPAGALARRTQGPAGAPGTARLHRRRDADPARAARRDVPHGRRARHRRALRPGGRRRRDQRAVRGAVLPARVRPRRADPDPRRARRRRRPRAPQRVPRPRAHARRLRRVAVARVAVHVQPPGQAAARGPRHQGRPVREVLRLGVQREARARPRAVLRQGDLGPRPLRRLPRRHAVRRDPPRRADGRPGEGRSREDLRRARGLDGRHDRRPEEGPARRDHLPAVPDRPRQGASGRAEVPPDDAERELGLRRGRGRGARRLRRVRGLRRAGAGLGAAGPPARAHGAQAVDVRGRLHLPLPRGQRGGGPVARPQADPGRAARSRDDDDPDRAAALRPARPSRATGCGSGSARRRSASATSAAWSTGGTSRSPTSRTTSCARSGPPTSCWRATTR